ncbi:hypothetical protein QP414_00780 [Corynebacterium simulans]|uniref:aldo/keto reductase n=1 Tax=Corynebacterium TaxID=1716 RepID=UPI0008A4FDB9|nr:MULTISPECIES: aldo/keto reductase [Corynebacterium]MDK7137843.1 hypothetical protein [Corynebacterium simulans]OFQ46987.1 hypothetical protein HMPREF2935_03425 [Corynebacterium sp. HMSC076D02]
MASRRISLVANDRLVEFARGRRGVRAGGIGKRDGHAVWAEPGHMGAKRQQRGAGEELGAQFIAKCAVPIPGSRQPEHLRENLAAADIVLTANEVADIDAALDATAMSDVFGGTKN